MYFCQSIQRSVISIPPVAEAAATAVAEAEAEAATAVAEDAIKVIICRYFPLHIGGEYANILDVWNLG